MVWSKVKNIIILILLLLNLCLLLLIVGQNLQSRRYEGETLKKTLEALALNGIAVEEDVLPGTMALPLLKVERNEAGEKRAAGLLLGSDVISTYSGGMSIYSSVKGNLSFYGGGAVAGELSLDWRELTDSNDPTDALLEGLGVTAWSVTAGEDSVSVIPVINDAPVFNGELVLRYDGNVLEQLEGRMPGICTPEAEQEKPITVPTALVALLEHITQSGTVCRSIQSMDAGYCVTSFSTDTARLTPCWRVSTDTVTFYIDALSGDVTRAN